MRVVRKDRFARFKTESRGKSCLRSSGTSSSEVVGSEVRLSPRAHDCANVAVRLWRAVFLALLDLWRYIGSLDGGRKGSA